MAQYLCLSATLLTSRYHGEEWPPSPARFFQALLAGVMTGGYRQRWTSCRPALLWLERLPPPDIYASKQTKGDSYRLSVPNNDFDAVAREWKKGSPADPARIRTLKTVQPRLLSSGGPHVHYVWNVGRESSAELEIRVSSLGAAASCLHTLGWGVDMAFGGASLRDELSFPGTELWEPAPFGEPLAIPIEGFLADLEDCYKRFLRRTKGSGVDPNTRPSVVGLKHYQRKGRVGRPFAAFRLVRPNSEMGTDQPYSRAPHESMRVAAWLRHATAEAFRDRYDQAFLNQYVLGHVESGDRSNRLSYVPLPSVGHRHVDGWIRRVAIVEPRSADGKVTREIRRTMAGALLFEEGKTEPACALAPIQDSEVAFYTDQSRSWRSVTPVILHGFNTQRRHLSLAKTEKLLLESFSKCGYPADSIREFSVQPAPLVPGAIGARDILVPKHLSSWPRYHVRVEFHTDVPGPLLIGIGRHYGIGVFVRED